MKLPSHFGRVIRAENARDFTLDTQGRFTRRGIVQGYVDSIKICAEPPLLNHRELSRNILKIALNNAETF
jgi:hypothetical protein